MKIEGTNVGPVADRRRLNERGRPSVVVQAVDREPLIELLIQPGAGSPGNMATPFYLDENHCQALVFQLQAAIAEVQARAVSL